MRAAALSANLSSAPYIQYACYMARAKMPFKSRAQDLDVEIVRYPVCIVHTSRRRRHAAAQAHVMEPLLQNMMQRAIPIPWLICHAFLATLWLTCSSFATCANPVELRIAKLSRLASRKLVFPCRLMYATSRNQAHMHTRIEERYNEDYSENRDVRALAPYWCTRGRGKLKGAVAARAISGCAHQLHELCGQQQHI
eukprot:IDg820t1